MSQQSASFRDIQQLFPSTKSYKYYVEEWRNAPELGVCLYKTQGMKRKREEDSEDESEQEGSDKNNTYNNEEKYPFSDAEKSEIQLELKGKNAYKPLTPPPTPKRTTWLSSSSLLASSDRPRKIRCIDGCKFSESESEDISEQELYPLRLTSSEQDRIIFYCHIQSHGWMGFKLGEIRSQKQLYEKIAQWYPEVCAGDIRKIAKVNFMKWWTGGDEKEVTIMHAGFGRWSLGSPKLNGCWEGLENAVKEGMVDAHVMAEETLVATLEVEIVDECS